uniref:Uncharacterized protein n=1 Tax=Anguilla anguilla TaxID=7936 RepID=A0A0E9WRC6_ANGAN
MHVRYIQYPMSLFWTRDWHKYKHKSPLPLLVDRQQKYTSQINIYILSFISIQLELKFSLFTEGKKL